MPLPPTTKPIDRPRRAIVLAALFAAVLGVLRADRAEAQSPPTTPPADAASAANINDANDADIVVIVPRGGTGQTRLSGQVLDYTGRELTLENANGRQQKIPAESIVAVQPRRSPRHQQADALFAQRKFTDALTLYRQEYDAETRPWVRRLILAKIVQCFRVLGELDRAGEVFLVLLRSDADSPWFSCIPLDWLPHPPAAQLEASARGWLTRDEAAAALLGASHLLTSPQRAAAAAKLDVLARGVATTGAASTNASSDGPTAPLVAAVAEAQRWRLAVATADARQVAAWRAALDKLPADLQAGPAFVVGSAAARQAQWTTAALLFLRGPLLAPQDRDVAAAGLLEAARAMKSLGDTAAAQRLLGEVVAQYADVRLATAEAQSLLEQLGAAGAASAAGAGNPAPAALRPIPSASVDAPELWKPIDERFIPALRARGLMALAVAYCEEQLARDDLTAERRAKLTIEWARALADQALAAEESQREGLWQRGDSVLADFEQRYPHDAWLPLVRFQAAIGALARGESLRRECELRGRPVTEAARAALRNAIARFAALERDLEQRLRQVQATSDAPTPAQLAALLTNAQFEGARALRNQGLCYPPESPDRANSLTQAVRQLTLLANLDRDEALRLPSRLDLAICQRLLGEYALAAAMLDAIENDQPPPEILSRCRAERLRLALAAGQLPAAIELLRAAPPARDDDSPEYDLASLEVTLAAWRSAAAAERDPWRAEVERLLATIARRDGPLWQRRAEMLVAGQVEGMGVEDVPMLVRVAENAYRSGEPAAAMAAYDRAAAGAAAQGDAARAFELGFTAATIAHQQHQPAEALARYRRWSLGQPQQKRAAEAHLLAVADAAALAGDGAPAALDQYKALLSEHLQHWPHDATSDDARLRLGRLLEYEKAWPEAVAAYQGIAPSAADFAAVVAAVMRCGAAQLASQRGDPPAAEAAAAAIIAWLEGVIVGQAGRLPEKWGPTERAAALAAAQMQLLRPKPDFDRAARVLQLAVQGAADAPSEWRTAAEVSLVCTLSGAGRGREASALLEKLAAADDATTGPEKRADDAGTTALFAVLDGLARVAAAVAPPQRGEVAAVRLQAVEALERRRDRLDASLAAQLASQNAAALVDAGRGDEAVALYRGLIAAQPQNAALQESLAQALTARGDRASLESALQLWAALAERRALGSDAWLQAEYAVAELHFRLGDRQRARRLLRVLVPQYPDLGGAELKAKFIELQRQLDR